MYTNFPIEEVRKQFPSLKRTHHNKEVVYFDGPGGSQTLQSSINAISDYLTKGGANRHGNFPTSIETEKMLATTRDDIKLLFNAEDTEVAFGPNATSLMFAVGRALARNWDEGDEIILTELEHHSNIDAWRTVAESKGVTVKYIPFNPSTLTLDLEVLPELLTSKTKLVAVGSASNCIGTITDVQWIAKLAKKVGAFVAVDAVHAIPHMYVDMKDQNIDMLFSSAYKFFAAHVGMAIIQKDLFESLNIYKVAPSPNNIPDRLEMGTQNHEGIATISKAIEFIASLGNGETTQEKIKSGYHNIEIYENKLARIIRSELSKIDKVTLYQADDSVPKTPTIAFRVDGISPKEFCIRMCEEHSVFIAEGDFYAKFLAERLGIRDSGSFIRAGIAPYNTKEEVNRFIKGVKEIIQTI